MAPLIPGELLPEPGELELNSNRPVTTITVANSGDRPIQVGSHFHFAEANGALQFDRVSARGQRLDIPAGTAIRFEPGDSRDVNLIPFAGTRRVVGFNGQITDPRRPTRPSHLRQAYAETYGPTTGDRVRLADTELVLEVEKISPSMEMK